MLTIDQMHEYNQSLLNDDYYELIPNLCLYCKHPIIINLDRTIMKCSNRYCPEHMAHKADIMLKDMGAKYIGARTAYGIITKNKLKNHMHILGLSLDDLPNSHSKEVKQKMWNELQKGRKQTLSKVLKMYQLDGIAEQTSNKIMEGYSSFETFFKDKEDIKDIIRHVMKALGQHEVTYHLARMCFHLLSAKDDLIEVEKYFEIVKLSSERLRICMTGEISTVYSIGNSFKPREKFLDYLNEKYSGIVSFISTGRNVSDSHFLLTDSTRKTGKYNDASRLGIPISNFAEFVQYIEHTYGEGNPEYTLNRRI